MSQQNSGDAAPVIPEGWRMVPVDLRAVPEKIAFEVFDAAQNFRNGGCEIGSLLAGLPTIPFRTEAEVRAEARREAFEQAAEIAAEYCWNRVKNKEDSSVAVFTSHTWQHIRDAIIAVGKAEFPELKLRPTEEIRREALEEAIERVMAARSAIDELVDSNDVAAFDNICVLMTCAIRAMIEKERA